MGGRGSFIHPFIQYYMCVRQSLIKNRMMSEIDKVPAILEPVDHYVGRFPVVGALNTQI